MTILNIIKLFDEDPDECFQRFIRGHIYIEGLLELLIKKTYSHPDALKGFLSSFYRKVKLLRANNTITSDEEMLLLTINKIRNKLSHNLTNNFDFDVMFEIVTLASKANIDFSDDTIHRSRITSEDWYGKFGLVQELFSNTFMHLIWKNEKLFTNEEIGNLLG